MEHTETIKKNYEFRRLYAKGKSAVTPTLVVYTRRIKTDGNRVGFTVTTRLGHAVTRNRVRRRLREIYRLHEAELRRGAELVVVARPRSVTAAYRELERDFLTDAGGYCPVKAILLWLIRFYRKNISPRKPPCCRFIPTCSQYALEAIEKYGAAKGGWLAFKRICRCHPFHTGEHDFYDPVP